MQTRWNLRALSCAHRFLFHRAGHGVRRPSRSRISSIQAKWTRAQLQMEVRWPQHGAYFCPAGWVASCVAKQPVTDWSTPRQLIRVSFRQKASSQLKGTFARLWNRLWGSVEGSGVHCAELLPSITHGQSAGKRISPYKFGFVLVCSVHYYFGFARRHGRCTPFGYCERRKLLPQQLGQHELHTDALSPSVA